MTKSLQGHPSELGRHVAALTHRFEQQGVRTPAATFDPSRNLLSFPRIRGLTGKEVAGRSSSLRASEESAFLSRQVLEQLFVPVAALHKASSVGVGVAPYDPWKRIHSRLEQKDCHSVDADEQSTRAQRLYSVLRHIEPDIRRLVPHRSQAVIHGDFHLGQVICQQNTKDWWLLDLDDLALGEPETDLGNFTAHYVTSPRLYDGEIGDGFSRLQVEVCTAYTTLTGYAIQDRALSFYGAASLLRRALKLRERDSRVPFVDAVIDAAERLVLESRLTDSLS